MAQYRISNLPKVVLDPRNDLELLEGAKNRTIAASNLKLSDFSKATALSALLTGEVFAISELLWYLNKLPTALAIELLRLFGVSRSLGTKATGAVTFLLSQSLSDNFILPIGYPIPFRDGVTYFTTEQLVISPGSYRGTVAVESGVVGTVGNIPKLNLVVTQPGLNYVSMIYNEEDIQGGTDVEPLEATVIRGQEAIRRRDTIVTAADYEAACQEILGYGSKAVAVPTMNGAKQLGQPGHVHVFLVDSTGTPPSVTVCQNVKATLKPLTFAGSSLWVSPVSLEEVYLDAVVEVSQISEEVANSCLEIVQTYLKPSNYALGSTLRVKELEYLLRTAEGVTAIQYVTINGDAINHPLPGEYYATTLSQFTLTQVTSEGVAQTFNLVSVADVD